MTMQNNESSGSSYFQSVTGQLLAFGVGLLYWWCLPLFSSSERRQRLRKI